VRAIGLISGTSLDGADVALIDGDGEQIACFGPAFGRTYRDVMRSAGRPMRSRRRPSPTWRCAG
jgi:1,6-anhydro-N-acetylmuramate kinase